GRWRHRRGRLHEPRRADASACSPAARRKAVGVACTFGTHALAATTERGYTAPDPAVHRQWLVPREGARDRGTGGRRVGIRRGGWGARVADRQHAGGRQ